MPLAFSTSGHFVPKSRKPGDGTRPSPGHSKSRHSREFFEQIGERLPQGRIVLLKLGNLLGIDAPVGVGLDRHLIEVIRTPAL